MNIHETPLYPNNLKIWDFGFEKAPGFDWKGKGDKIYRGSLAGSFLILVFGSRFFLEFFKNPMSVMFDESLLQTGQLLSLPFIFLGVLLVGYGYRKSSFHTALESKNEG